MKAKIVIINIITIGIVITALEETSFINDP